MRILFENDLGQTEDATFELRESLDAPDGNLKTFSFSSALLSIVACFIGGVAQSPGDVSTNLQGQLVIGNSIAPPEATASVLVLGTFA